MKRNKLILVVFLALAACFAFSCKEKDEHVPPNLSFTSGSGYTSADATVSAGSTVKIGIVATKTEDDMKTVNVSHSLNSGASVSDYTYTLTGSQQQNFSADYTTTATGTAGDILKISITVTDNDGNITSRTITLTLN